MIEAIVGNRTMEKVLLYLEQYGRGYSKQIADTFGVPVSMVQKQLQRLEAGGVIISLFEGKTRVYAWNPRFALRQELRALVRKALGFIPDDEQKRYFRERKRPRRVGKPA